MFAALFLPTASAGPDDRVWAMTAYNDVCRVSLSEDADRIGEGDVRRLDNRCRISPVTRYRVVDQGSILFLDDGGTLLGRVDPLSRGGYSGVIDDGVALEFSLIMTRPDPRPTPRPKPIFTPRPPLDIPTGRGQTASDCLRYPDTGLCAQNQDVGLPGDRFNLLPIETRARMNVHFMGNSSSSVEGQVAPRTCMPVKNCSESLLNKEVWCQVNWKDNKWGWVLKQDREFVYAHAGCG